MSRNLHVLSETSGVELYDVLRQTVLELPSIRCRPPGSCAPDHAWAESEVFVFWIVAGRLLADRQFVLLRVYQQRSFEAKSTPHGGIQRSQWKFAGGIESEEGHCSSFCILGAVSHQPAVH